MSFLNRIFGPTKELQFQMDDLRTSLKQLKSNSKKVELARQKAAKRSDVLKKRQAKFTKLLNKNKREKESVPDIFSVFENKIQLVHLYQDVFLNEKISLLEEIVYTIKLLRDNADTKLSNRLRTLENRYYQISERNISKYLALAKNEEFVLHEKQVSINSEIKNIRRQLATLYKKCFNHKVFDIKERFRSVITILFKVMDDEPSDLNMLNSVTTQPYFKSLLNYPNDYKRMYSSIK